MNKNKLTEYADILMKVAISKCDNLEDAKDLVQETLLAALTSINKGKEISDTKNWLMTVLNHKYYDMLRQKYRKPTVCIDEIGEIPDESTFDESAEDAENIRRCLATLTGTYREVLVQYYMNGKSVSDISQLLKIPEDTVKTRLFTGRKHIQKEFTMETYTKQSYEPDDLFISNSGLIGYNDEPFSLVRDDRITMNLLILAYKKPITLSELSKAIGIPTAYIEPIVAKLVAGQLMKRVSDKVYTDFIIYSEQDRMANLDLQLKLAKELCDGIWHIVSEGLVKLRQNEFYKQQSMDQALKLESFFFLRTITSATLDVRDEAGGGREPSEHYPERPNGGKWYAMGNLYPHGYDYENCPYSRYNMSGECVHTQQNLLGAKEVSMCSYDTDSSVLGANYHDNSDDAYLKFVYSIYLGKTDMMEMLDNKMLKDINQILEFSIMYRDEEGKLKVNIPVITMSDRWELYSLSNKYKKEIVETYHGKMIELVRKPVKLPKHLKSVPNWLKYLVCCSYFPSAIISEAKDRGLFLKGYDKPAPAVILCVEK
ncbi:RNA polymerase sigma factor [Butyrivibrio sp. MC2021]|uniref:RNA polymerase sigma factor n=1 Tax=Butyrivibrio sp. MC2021 TaxID=1408306 RepID=UPI0004787C52|nr:RNA polymerase sigma factor [Butyrivibrio sp. MC2021]